MVKKDYYLILGVSPSESSTGIRKAFRKLVKDLHPDRVGPEGTKRFQDITEAYQVLSDPNRRAEYHRIMDLQPPASSPKDSSTEVHVGAQAPEPLLTEPRSLIRDFGTVRPSLEELYERIARNFTGIGIPKGEQPEGLNVEMILSSEEAARGGNVSFDVPVFHPCPYCGGLGRNWLFPCLYCEQHGIVEDEERVTLRIPPQVRHGSVYEIPLEGLGIHNFYLRVHILIDRET